MHRALAPAFAALAVASAAALAGCTPAIGDRCTVSTDCSAQGGRACDTSQPAGYCTVLQCTAGSCPDNATCVQLGASLPGCSYDGYEAPSRLGRLACLKTCSSTSDCRQSDGYVCAKPPAGAVILDNDQTKSVCVVGGSLASFSDADVCSSGRIDASPIEASVSSGSGGEDGAQEASADAQSDAVGDSAPEASPAAHEDAGDGQAAEAPADAGAQDGGQAQLESGAGPAEAAGPDGEAGAGQADAGDAGGADAETEEAGPGVLVDARGDTGPDANLDATLDSPALDAQGGN